MANFLCVLMMTTLTPVLRWSLWEPHELATLSLSLSLDPFLVPVEEPSPVDKLMGKLVLCASHLIWLPLVLCRMEAVPTER